MESPEAIVDAIYELISFGPGGDPAWRAFRGLFAEQCVLALRLFPGDPAISILSLDDYVRKQVREDMKEEGYAERPWNAVSPGQATSHRLPSGSRCCLELA